MKKTAFSLVLTVIFAAPAGAQTMSGAAGLQYYVGAWACVAGPTGSPPAPTTATYTLDSGVLRGMIVVPPTGRMTSPYSLSINISLDAKNKRFVQTSLDSTGNWDIAYAPQWTTNTEVWTDQQNTGGKLYRNQTVRTDATNFAFTGYATVTSTEAVFQGSCKRSS